MAGSRSASAAASRRSSSSTTRSSTTSRATFSSTRTNASARGLPTDTLTYKGPHFSYENVPIALRPLQQPHPPFWYGSSNTIGSTWAGEHGMHFVTLGPMPTAKANIDAFKEAFAKRGRAAQPKAEFPGGVAIGVQRHIFVDETDEKAKRWAKPAMDSHLANMNWIRNQHGVTTTAGRMKNVRGSNFEECVEEGTVIAGSPPTVRAEIERQHAELGFNYLLTYLFFGTMSAETAMRSLKLFISEVMPGSRADVRSTCAAKRERIQPDKLHVRNPATRFSIRR